MIGSALTPVYDAKKHSIVNARNLRISTKDSVEIGKFITGMSVVKAKKYLENVIVMKYAIPVKRHTEGAGHKAQIKGPGTYPVTAATKYMELIASAEKNAEFKNIEIEKLNILHVSATIGNRFYRPRKYGLRGQHTKSTNISLILGKKRKKVKS
ncbi:MAG: 50S ribosomal protein L22 [Candidatus Aenigmarchaeota archaeon]|nr:50S ribosomal protein L22 [Candidatus Aenigmarchaeota archaeon]